MSFSLPFRLVGKRCFQLPDYVSELWRKGLFAHLNTKCLAQCGCSTKQMEQLVFFFVAARNEAECMDGDPDHLCANLDFCVSRHSSEKSVCKMAHA